MSLDYGFVLTRPSPSAVELALADRVVMVEDPKYSHVFACEKTGDLYYCLGFIYHDKNGTRIFTTAKGLEDIALLCTGYEAAKGFRWDARKTCIRKGTYRDSGREFRSTFVCRRVRDDEWDKALTALIDAGNQVPIREGVNQ